MLKFYKFKLYLNKKQEETLDSWLEISCRVYNEGLQDRINIFENTGKGLSLYDQEKKLTQWRKEVSILKSVPRGFLNDALRRLDHGFKQFFRRLVKGGQSPGFPRFKNVKKYKSMTFLDSRTNMYIQKEGKIYIPVMGFVSARGNKEIILGWQKGIVIYKRASGWYVIVIMQIFAGHPKKVMVSTAVGLDYGLDNLITTSDDVRYTNPKYLKKLENKLIVLSKKLSRKVQGSNKYRKLRKSIALLHENIASQRRSNIHEITTELIKNNDLIVIEKLKIANLAKNSFFSKSIYDCGWGIVREQLKYKAENAGKTIVEVNPQYTSQECPNCGHIKPKTLYERIHNCSNCGCIMDRDHAAAQVILKRGLSSPVLAGRLGSLRDGAIRPLVDVRSS